MTLFDGLLPAGIATISAHVGPLDEAPPLWPGEDASIASAVPARRAEFSWGRWCAREAMRQLGLPPQSVPANDDRSPVWPAGVVGSISHSEQHCAAAIASSEYYTGVGIDIESNTALDTELWAIVCTAGERAFIEAQPPEAQGAIAKLLFSAKESIYKLQAPVTGRFLDFTDIELTIDLTTGVFLADPLTFPDLLPGHSTAAGRFVFRNGLILTASAITRD